jgi:N-glycosylase/DNA lyase
MSQPRPPPGYTSLPVSSTQILLPLTISNKCGQSFRWRGVEVFDGLQEEVAQVKLESTNGGVKIKKEEDDPMTTIMQTTSTSTYRKTIEWSICLSDRVVFVRQDEERGYLYHRTMLGDTKGVSSETSVAESTAAWLQDYLNLAIPLAELYEEWSDKDEVFKRFAKRFTGVRMLRQDPWECLCA